MFLLLELQEQLEAHSESLALVVKVLGQKAGVIENEADVEVVGMLEGADLVPWAERQGEHTSRASLYMILAF